MTSELFVFFLTCLVAGANGQKKDHKSSSCVQQRDDFLSVSVGENVTLECSYKGQELKRMFWSKKSLGQKPELICSFYVHSTEVTFFGEFKNNPRFKLDTENKNHHLKIFNSQLSDSATYNCIHCDNYALTFLENYNLHVKDSSSYIQTSVDQTSSKNIHAGDSVTLNCTVHTGSCDGEHRVYWFKDSEDSHPGLIYTHGGRNDQCERNNNTQTHSCHYELPMKNLTESHAGIYYCAVASCGHILFGNGTKLDLTVSELDGSFPPFVYFLSGVLTASLIFLTFYTIHKTLGHKSKEKRSAAPSVTTVKGNEMSGSRTLMEDTWSQCVYFRTKQQS